MRTLIMPEAIKAVNTAPAYADLRRVYLSRVAAEWFRQRSARKQTPVSGIVNSGNVDRWATETPWDPKEVFGRYLQSLRKGEWTAHRKVQVGDRVYERTMIYGGVDFSQTPSTPVTKRDFKSRWPRLAKRVHRAQHKPAEGDGELWFGGGDPKDAIGSVSLHLRTPQRRVQAGDRVPYRLRVRNPAGAAVRRARICDRLPADLAFVRASPRARVQAGWHCFEIPRIGGHRTATIRLTTRVVNGARGRAVNEVTATVRDSMQGSRARHTLRVAARRRRSARAASRDERRPRDGGERSGCGVHPGARRRAGDRRLVGPRPVAVVGRDGRADRRRHPRPCAPRPRATDRAPGHAHELVRTGAAVARAEGSAAPRPHVAEGPTTRPAQRRGRMDRARQGAARADPVLGRAADRHAPGDRVPLRPPRAPLRCCGRGAGHAHAARPGRNLRAQPPTRPGRLPRAVVARSPRSRTCSRATAAARAASRSTAAPERACATRSAAPARTAASVSRTARSARSLATSHPGRRSTCAARGARRPLRPPRGLEVSPSRLGREVGGRQTNPRQRVSRRPSGCGLSSGAVDGHRGQLER